MADLSPLTYGQVVGRFLAIVGDSIDSGDSPDAVPFTGTVTFTPALTRAQVASAEPDPAVIVPMPVVVPLDTSGYLSWAGQTGVHLLATDDESINPTGFTYSVSFQLTLEGAPIPFPVFNIEVPAGETVDLTLATPLDEVDGVYSLVGPQGPQGIQGIQGEPGAPPETYTAWGDLDGISPSSEVGSLILADGGNTEFGGIYNGVEVYAQVWTSGNVQRITITPVTSEVPDLPDVWVRTWDGAAWNAWVSAATTPRPSADGVPEWNDTNREWGASYMVSSLDDPDTLVQRTSDGTVKVAEPIDHDDAATKQYVDDTAPTLPVGDGVFGWDDTAGDWVLVGAADTNTTPDSLVLRTPDGTVRTDQPLAGNDAAPKQYVDDELAEGLGNGVDFAGWRRGATSQARYLGTYMNGASIIKEGVVPVLAASNTETAQNTSPNADMGERVPGVSIARTSAASACAGWSITNLPRRDEHSVEYRFRLSTWDGTELPGHRFFVGLYPASSAPTDVDPSGLLNLVGVGYDSADSQFYVMHNDGSGSATKIALSGTAANPTSGGLAKPTVPNELLIEVLIRADQNGYSLRFQTTTASGGSAGVSTEWTWGGVYPPPRLETDIPSASLGRSAAAYLGVGGATNAAGIRHSAFEFRTYRDPAAVPFPAQW